MTQQESREAARKRAEVMIAYSQGKKIEYCHPTLKEWAPVCAPLWDWSSTEYRVAPEPWTGKIWVHPDGNSRFHYPTIDAEKWVQGGWRLITVKEVADE